MAGLRRYGIALGLAALGAVSFVLGICRGEQDAVFIKAVNICMECIGLG